MAQDIPQTMSGHAAHRMREMLDQYSVVYEHLIQRHHDYTMMNQPVPADVVRLTQYMNHIMAMLQQVLSQ